MKSGRSGGRCCKRFALLPLTICLLPSVSVWAAPPLLTDDTGTQGKGNWQLELQGDFLRSDRTAGGVERKSRLDAYAPVLSYGIVENLDIQLGTAYVKQRTSDNGVVTEEASGVTDTAVDIKWRFYDADGFSLALKSGLLLPTGDENKGLGTGSTSWGAALLATLESGRWAFHGNVAYAQVRFRHAQDEAESRSDLWRVSAGVSYGVTEEVKLVGEAGLRSNESKSDPFQPDRTSQFAMIGVIYSPTKQIDLDLGFRKNFNQAEFDKAFLVGATFRW